MTDASAQLKNYRQSPRKVRLVADLIRGKSAERALDILGVLPKRASESMMKLLRSAVANAKGKGFEASDLYISRIEVNGGIVFKRSMPRARGRSSMIKKKTSHITLGLSKKIAPKKAVAAQ
ncbi:50S ribosomal protein L22 [Acetobacteraceae bacterium]|nr:50S ribosomal protein L22 [Candidatus Parcubacteria bacterium]